MPKHKRPPCICGSSERRLPGVKGRVHQATSCGRYKAYTDGYCRNCSHSRACCKR